jgi:hypothetical protein
MKKLMPILLLAAAVATGYVVYRTQGPTYVAPSLAAQETIPAQLAAQPGSDEVVRVLDVEGLCDCGGCRGKLYRALVEVAGVRAGAVDSAGCVSAIVSKDFDAAALAKALTFGQYVAHLRP